VTQRAALIGVVRTIDAAIVTTDPRARWLSSRVWLARRPVATAPVFSNLPAASSRSRPPRDGFVLGLFGYSHLENSVSVVLDSLRLLQHDGHHAGLVLLGSPGRRSPSGDAWVAQARSRGVEASLSFSGTLPPQALSNALADCDVLLCAYTAGPSSRKGSLAASLASGRPVVVLDGPGRWPALVESGAAGVARPTAEALCESIRVLLSDEGLREELGARGRLFAERRMGVAVTAAAVTDLLEEVLAEGADMQGDSPSEGGQAVGRASVKGHGPRARKR
jgi:glycosyltransferase involved in cell wall biosynthesis